MTPYTILGTPLYEFLHTEPSVTDYFVRVDEQDKILEEFGFSRTNRTEYLCHFFDSVFFDEQITEVSIDEAIEALAIKDGVDIVKYNNGNIGFVAYYNGNVNGFEIFDIKLIQVIDFLKQKIEEELL